MTCEVPSAVATDVDSAATFVAQSNAAGSNGYGTFSIDAAGVWTYTMNDAHDEFVGGITTPTASRWRCDIAHSQNANTRNAPKDFTADLQANLLGSGLPCWLN